LTKKGKLIGIGVGPGDSELLTLKAMRILGEVDVICAPRSAPERKSVALSIVNDVINDRVVDEEVKILEPVFPMVEDKKQLKNYWKEASELISEKLDEGLDVAFVTLGDPSIYSTFSYVQKILKNSYDVEMVPGITSFTSCAASINQPLVEKDEILMVVPKIDKRIDKILETANTIALMKTSRNQKKLEEKINSSVAQEIISVENSSKSNEKVIKGFSTDKPYFTTTIIKLK
jgi:precorrin-2/cobalt-factor-2 C20-methyltransferase